MHKFIIPFAYLIRNGQCVGVRQLLLRNRLHLILGVYEVQWNRNRFGICGLLIEHVVRWAQLVQWHRLIAALCVNCLIAR